MDERTNPTPTKIVKGSLHRCGWLQLMTTLLQCSDLHLAKAYYSHNYKYEGPSLPSRCPQNSAMQLYRPYERQTEKQWHHKRPRRFKQHKHPKKVHLE